MRMNEIIKWCCCSVFYTFAFNLLFTICVVIIIMKYIGKIEPIDAYYPICGAIIFGTLTLTGILLIIDDIHLLIKMNENK